MEKISSRYKWLYICCITIMIVCIFGPVMVNHKMYMFIDIGADTYSGNWPTLEQGVRWWKECAKNLWSFQTGLGSSIFISTDTYFDPFILVLFPFANIADGINLMMIVKYFVLGYFAFKFYEKFGLKDFSVLMASICHTFCGFMVGWGQHYTFSTCFTLFTILLYSIERFRKNKKWGMIAFVTAITCCFSAYFSYIILLFIAFWVIGRYIVEVYNKRIQLSIKCFFGFCMPYAGAIVLGIFISMPIFLQQVELLLNSPRVSGGNTFNLDLNSISAIETYIIRMFSNVLIGINETISEQNFYESPILYTSIFSIFGIIGFLFEKLKRKKYGLIASYFIAFFCIILFPNLIHPIFNGLSDNTTRWLFVVVPLLCIASVRGFEAIVEKRVSGKVVAVTGLFLVLAFCIYYFVEIFPKFQGDISNIKLSIFCVLIVSLLYGVLITQMEKTVKDKLKIFFTCILCFELGTNAILCIKDRTLSNNIGNGKEYFATSNYFDGTKEINETLRQNEQFFRLAKTYNKIDLNAPAKQDYYGETYYKSFYSSYMSDFIEQYNLRQVDSNYFYGFDGKDDLRNLFGAKYLLTHEELDFLDYEKILAYENINVYENRNSVGLSIAYDSYITKEEWENLDMSPAASVLYNSCVIEDEKQVVQIEHITGDTAFDVRNTEIEYSIDKDYEKGLIMLTVENPVSHSLQLEFQCLSNHSFKIQYSSEMDFSDELSIEVIPDKEEQSWTIPAKNIKQILITLSDKNDINSFSDITLYERKDDEISKIIDYVKMNQLEVQSFEEDRIVGKISCKKNKILAFSIPYSSGWKIYIDGVQQKSFPVNVAFLGVNIPEGEHEVELVYFPMSLQIGLVCTIISCMIIFFLIVLWIKKQMQESKYYNKR